MRVVLDFQLKDWKRSRKFRNGNNIEIFHEYRIIKNATKTNSDLTINFTYVA